MEIRHFVLVHGSCHGAWCWYKVVTLLESMGHKVTAPDLASSGINNIKKLDQIHTISDYTEPLTEFMEALPSEERVILVGHSMGGLSISIAMERFPNKIAAAVFVSAFMPGPDLPFTYILEQVKVVDPMDNTYTYGKGRDNPPTAMLLGPKYLASVMYHLSPPQDLILGTLLMRPGPLFNYPETLKGLSPSKKNYGSVRRVYIICNDDRAMYINIQKWMVENNPPDEAKVLDGADHMPMFSTSSQLFSSLLEVAKKYK